MNLDAPILGLLLLACCAFDALAQAAEPEKLPRAFTGGWSHSTERSEPVEDRPEELAKFAKFFQSPVDLGVYEGLPHQNLERDLFMAELFKAGMDREGYFFYPDKLPISKEDETKLQDAFVRHAESGILFYVTGKRCGGFHPDYLITWNNQQREEYDTMICFGCNEIVITRNHTSFRRDLSGAFLDELKAILKKYIVNRPSNKSAPATSPETPAPE